MLPEQLTHALASLPAPTQPAQEHADAEPPQPHTIRSVGSSGIIVADAGIVRVGETLAGWRLDNLSAGVGVLVRGDDVVRVRSGSVFDPASGRVSR